MYKRHAILARQARQLGRTMQGMNAHVASVFVPILNDFAKLDAQSPMCELATVASNEPTVDVAFAVPIKPACTIHPEDIGDEDCRKIVYAVWADNEEKACGFNSPKVAAEWAEAKGYRVTV